MGHTWPWMGLHVNSDACLCIVDVPVCAVVSCLPCRLRKAYTYSSRYVTCNTVLHYSVMLYSNAIEIWSTRVTESLVTWVTRTNTLRICVITITKVDRRKMAGPLQVRWMMTEWTWLVGSRKVFVVVSSPPCVQTWTNCGMHGIEDSPYCNKIVLRFFTFDMCAFGTFGMHKNKKQNRPSLDSSSHSFGARILSHVQWSRSTRQNRHQCSL